MNNLLSYCGLIDAKIKASDKDLPVKGKVCSLFKSQFWVHKISAGYRICIKHVLLLKAAAGFTQNLSRNTHLDFSDLAQRPDRHAVQQMAVL